MLCNLRHHRTFAFVAVSTTTDDSKEFALAYFVDGLNDVINSIWSVRVIDDCRPSFGRSDCLEASIDRCKCGEHAKNFDFVETEINCSSIDAEEITYIKSSNQRDENLLSVELQEHSIKTFFENLCAIIRHRACGIGINGGFAVLGHDETILIVLIGDSKRCRFEVVEEAFFCITIVIECLVIINVVACEIGEKCAVEVESSNTSLRDRVAADLHESMGASCSYHFGE